MAVLEERTHAIRERTHAIRERTRIRRQRTAALERATAQLRLKAEIREAVDGIVHDSDIDDIA